MAEAPVAEGKPRLYSDWRSSCSHRARIVLNLKGVDYEHKSVNLLKGEQSDPEFMKLNPMKFVPVLVDGIDGDAVIGDSNTIAMYLEDKYPERPLLPQDLKKKGISRGSLSKRLVQGRVSHGLNNRLTEVSQLLRT